MTTNLFIDGQAGTTGLQIDARVRARPDLKLIVLDEKQRRDPRHRAEAINSADVAILCLPDDAAREAMTLVSSDRVRIIDTSTAHRTQPGWVYGLPEYSAEQPGLIASSRFIANPGCYPTGAVLLLNPLVRAGLLQPGYPVCIQGISGYTGGGKKLIERFEKADSPDYIRSPFRAYGLDLNHKHVNEMRVYCGLDRTPIFTPGVGRFPQGMIVQIGLYLDDLPGKPTAKALHEELARYYAGQKFVEVAAPAGPSGEMILDVDQLVGTDKVRLHVFENEKHRQAVLVAVLDNLGKGAAGSAMQNLDLLIGSRQATGKQPTRRAAVGQTNSRE